MKKLGCLTLVLGALLTLLSCNAPQPSTVKMLYLNHYRVECAGPFLRLCYLDRENTDDTWSYRYSDVIGLEYEWGYTYMLRVREEQVPNPLRDQSSIKTTLLEVLRKEKVSPDVRFQIELTIKEGSDEYSEQYIVQKAADLFEFHQAKEFTCPKEVCAQLSGLLDENWKVTLEFSHPENLKEPLIAYQIVSTQPLSKGY